MIVGPTHHVGVTVSDLDRAVAFYRDVPGLPVVDRLGGDASVADLPEDVEALGGQRSTVTGTRPVVRRDPDGTVGGLLEARAVTSRLEAGLR